MLVRTVKAWIQSTRARRRALTEAPATLEELVYSPDPAVWHPLSLLRLMVSDSWRFRELVRRLVVRDIRAQYRQSVLGYLWAFIPPLAMAVGFSLARDAGVLQIADTGADYVVFVIAGTILWQTFTDALNGPIQALSSFQSVLSRIYVPPEILVLAKLGEVAVNLSIKLILLVVVFALYGVPTGVIALTALPLLAVFILEGAAIGLILSPVAALYHDVTKGLPIVTGFWFLLTPVVYPVPQAGAFSLIVRANPVTPFLVAIRDVLTGGPTPDPALLAMLSVLWIVVFTLALVVFRVAMPFVIERASA